MKEEGPGQDLPVNVEQVPDTVSELGDGLPCQVEGSVFGGRHRSLTFRNVEQSTPEKSIAAGAPTVVQGSTAKEGVGVRAGVGVGVG